MCIYEIENMCVPVCICINYTFIYNLHLYELFYVFVILYMIELYADLIFYAVLRTAVSTNRVNRTTST